MGSHGPPLQHGQAACQGWDDSKSLSMTEAVLWACGKPGISRLRACTLESSTPGSYQDPKSYGQSSECSSRVGQERAEQRAASAPSSKQRPCDSKRQAEA